LLFENYGQKVGVPIHCWSPNLKVGGPVSPGPHGCCAYEHEQQRRAHQDETEVQSFAAGTVKSPRHTTGTDETSWRRQRRRRDVAHGDDDARDDGDPDVGEVDEYVGDEDNLDLLALKDADIDAGEHDGLVVLNVDDEDLNVLNNEDDDVHGMMIFQWSVNLSAVLANGDVDRNHELPRDTCSFVVRSVQR